MNAITRYKKITLLAVAAITMNVNIAVLAECSPCAAAAARSAAVAQAALIVASKAIAREAELDAVPEMSRAPHGQLFNPFAECENQCAGFNGCDLNSKLQSLFNCCVNTNHQVKCQGHEAEKCCKKLRHELDEVEDELLVIETDLSVIESLIVGQSVAAAACCSLTSTMINNLNISITDQINALSLSIADVIIIANSIFDCTCA